MISLVRLVLVFFFIFEVIQHIFSFFTSPVKVTMVIMLESTPKKGGERWKRPLHTVNAPDFRSPGVKNLVETVFSCLPLFEPIPASKIAIDHQVGQDVHRALISPVHAGDSLTPTADDYANLLFHESSNDDGVVATLDGVDRPPAPVIVVSGVSPIPIPLTTTTCRIALPSLIPVTDPRWQAMTARDRMVRTGPCADGTIG
jgi:hypothetical protein